MVDNINNTSDPAIEEMAFMASMHLTFSKLSVIDLVAMRQIWNNEWDDDKKEPYRRIARYFYEALTLRKARG